MPSKLKENIKSVILVVLFLTTILLLYLIWGGAGSGGVSFSDLIPSAKPEEVHISAKEVIVPQEAYYTNGDGAFIKIAASEESYKAYNDALVKLCNQGSALVTEITEEQYREAVEKYESVQFNFGYNVWIPFSEYCSLYGINRTSSFANVSTFDTMAFSSAAPDSVLLADLFGNKYYRLVGETSNAKYENLVVTGPADIAYYDVSSILGEGNGSLFPLQANSNLLEAKYKKVYDGSEEQRAEIARNIFQDNFSFVRRISDNFGNYTFMYGYGQKSLTLGSGGSISYKEEIQSGDSKGFMGDLETAVNFIESIIGFKTRGCRYILEYAETIGSGKSASHLYHFCQQTENGYKILNPGYAISILVEKGKVSAFTAEGIVPDERYISGFYTAAANPANAIAAAIGSTMELDILANNMISMTPAVFLQHDGTLKPVWCLALHDLGHYNYDLYSGEFIE